MASYITGRIYARGHPNCRQLTLSAIFPSKFRVFESLRQPKSGAWDFKQSILAGKGLRQAAGGTRILARLEPRPAAKRTL